MRQFLVLRRLVLLVCISAFFLTGCKKNDLAPDPEPAPPPPAPLTTVLVPVTTPVVPGVNGYYISMPSNYHQTTEKYPLLIYIPGGGQFGNGPIDLPLLLKAGPAELADEKRLPATFKVNGHTYSLLVFTPQLKWWPATSLINDCIDFVKANYRVDSTRIYLSGLSLGGILTCDFAGEFPNKLAAILPMAGVPADYVSSNACQQIAAGNLPVWAFHSADDTQIEVTSAIGFKNRINSFNPAIQARLTVWPNGGHDAWTKAIEPGYRENGLNIYEWMLQYHR